MENLANVYKEIEGLAREFPAFVKAECLGRTLLGREIPLLHIGTGERAIFYVGAHHGTDLLTSEVLLAFARDVAECAERRATQYAHPIFQMLCERSLYVLPLANPDGASYVTGSGAFENPLWERAQRMNGGNDFFTWQANARGVDLAHNYAAGFMPFRGNICGAPQGFAGEHPESEPESAAIAAFLRREAERLVGVLELGFGAGEILCSCEDNLSAKCQSAGRALSRLTGLRQRRPEITPPKGSLCDYSVRVLGRPAFLLDCVLPQKCEAALEEKMLFASLRRALFCFPYLV